MPPQVLQSTVGAFFYSRKISLRLWTIPKWIVNSLAGKLLRLKFLLIQCIVLSSVLLFASEWTCFILPWVMAFEYINFLHPLTDFLSPSGQFALSDRAYVQFPEDPVINPGKFWYATTIYTPSYYKCSLKSYFFLPEPYEELQSFPQFEKQR